KVIAANGMVQYSNISMIKRNGVSNTSVTVYPNPASDLFMIRFTSLETNHANISVIDDLGKTIISKNAIVSKGINSVQMNASSLASGIYSIRIKNGEEVMTS